jgi:hypothetical protein
MSKVGANNPNWRGGMIEKSCVICSRSFRVKPVNRNARHCSLQCVGIGQRGRKLKSRKVQQSCVVCGAAFPVEPSRLTRRLCCSASCSSQYRAQIRTGAGNPNWAGGVSRLPYPWNFRRISRAVIERDGHRCQNPDCPGTDRRLTTHHINYDKSDCRADNLICLCSACNSRANFDRPKWQSFYSTAVQALAKKHGGGWKVELF